MKHTIHTFLLIAFLFFSVTGLSQKLSANIDRTVWNIYQDANCNYWFGSKGNGLYFYDGHELKQYTKADGLAGNSIRGIQEDKSGNIFIETLSGISKYNGRSFETLQVKEPDAINNQWKLGADDLWFRIGFDTAGPYRYDGENLYYLPLPKSPQETIFREAHPTTSYTPYGIYKIYKDTQGNIWFGTSGVGVCHYDGQSHSWHYEEQLQTTPGGGDFGTRAIIEDSDGYYWINNTRYRYTITSTSGEQLAVEKESGIGYNNTGETEFSFFLDITEDDNGDLWMVTYDEGVWQYDGEKLTNYPIKNGRMDVFLFDIYKDRDGALWLGSHNDGVYKYDGEKFVKFTY